MNILYINNSVHLGGDTKCILKLCKEFIKENNVFIASEDGILKSKFEELGIKHFTLVDVENRNFLNVCKNIMLIRKIIKDNKIDIIHSHHRMTTLYAKIISIFTKVKVIHTVHAFTDDKKILTHFILKNTKVIAISEGIKRNLIDIYKIRNSNINLIYNTIDFEESDEAISEELINAKKNGYFCVGSIGRLVEIKGINFLLMAAKESSKLDNKIKFFIIGDGPLEENFKKYIKENNLESSVYLLGRKSNIKEHIRMLDLIIQPSLSEGLGLSAIESLSQGKPIIVSDIPGLKEVVKCGYNGKCFKKADSKMLLKNILEIYNDSQLYKELSKNSIAFYNKKFNSQKYYLQHKKIYNYKS